MKKSFRRVCLLLCAVMLLNCGVSAAEAEEDYSVHKAYIAWFKLDGLEPEDIAVSYRGAIAQGQFVFVHERDQVFDYEDLELDVGPFTFSFSNAGREDCFYYYNEADKSFTKAAEAYETGLITLPELHRYAAYFSYITARNEKDRFTDDNYPDFWNRYEARIYACKFMGLLRGYPDGSFRPEENMTRAQAATLLATAMELDTDSAPACAFSDVPQDQWFAPYVNALVAEGVINGYPDGSFHPNAPLTRAEAVKLIVTAKAFVPFEEEQYLLDDVSKGHWGASYINAAVSNGVSDGDLGYDGTFKPDKLVSRGEFTDMICRPFELGVITKSNR